MNTMGRIFYKVKLAEEKAMLIKIASAVIEDEANAQFTICFWDGSIIQYDQEPQESNDISVADAVRFINELEPEITRELIFHLKPQKRGNFVKGVIKVDHTFTDGSCFTL